MPVTLEALPFLTSPTGETLLVRLAGEDLGDAHTLRLLTVLRREYSASDASAALELARLRRDAAAKFGADAAQLFFTRDALEQASDPRIRRYRAQIWVSQPDMPVVDACCGIGADLLALAAAGAQVTGVELDPLRATLARLNIAALGMSAQILESDVRDGLPTAALVFFDPARREAGKRLHHVEQYHPPLSTLKSWQHSQIKVKLSPGVDLAELADYHGDIEFISTDGDLKEALLHLPGGGVRSATVITGEAVHRLHDDGRQVRLREPQGWLCEPDPAVIRAGLVQSVAAQHDGALLDESIAYYTADTPPAPPFARGWQIESWQPFSVKRLREVLRARGVGRVTVKKRGTAVTPEVLIPQLKLKGEAERVIVLTRLRGQQIALVCLPHLS
jgi:SAM-dependent methyltransferase